MGTRSCEKIEGYDLTFFFQFTLSRNIYGLYTGLHTQYDHLLSTAVASRWTGPRLIRATMQAIESMVNKLHFVDCTLPPVTIGARCFLW